MVDMVGRGATITLDAFYKDASNAAVDPTNPKVSILDPASTVVVSLATPTHVGLGHYQYEYPVDVGAQLGAWQARWFGLVNGVQVGPVDDGFTVVAAGSIDTSTRTGQTCQPWVTSGDPYCQATLDAGVSSAELDICLQIATDVLWNLTGRRWSGVCTDSIRPQAQWKKWDGYGPRFWAASQTPLFNFGVCTCHRSRETGCNHIPEIRLPNGPVVPDSPIVHVNGELFTDWRVDDGRWLVRTDGEGWPCCQNLLLDDTEDRTWSVVYEFGSMPPIGGARMAAVYGCQLALSFSPDLAGKCRLPKRVTRITRQGVTASAVDPETLVEKGQLGLVEVDAWVGSIINGNKRRRATVMVPGRWRGSRRVNH